MEKDGWIILICKNNDNNESFYTPVCQILHNTISPIQFIITHMKKKVYSQAERQQQHHYHHLEEHQEKSWKAEILKKFSMFRVFS